MAKKHSFTKISFALTLGIVGAIWHAIWSILVWQGVAQRFVNWMFTLHFIRPPYSIQSFDFQIAAGLVGMAFATWFVFGLVIIYLWSWLKRN